MEKFEIGNETEKKLEELNIPYITIYFGTTALKGANYGESN